ncbi:hypothetical protein EIP86_008170 [Pleurotus ostreatoroseus]|nr:hypothetical protein EIP86_008170 [Pleurotus ostreatoroseus]
MLATLAGTSVQFNKLVSRELLLRFETMLRPFMTDLTGFCDCMLDTKTVISGSSAVFFFEGQPAWVPRDLDLYTTFEGFHVIIAYLVAFEGYKVVTKRARLIDDAIFLYTTLSGSVLFHRLERGDGMSIDICASRTDCPLYPIASFWSPLLMNYITPNSFCCAYPELLDSKLIFDISSPTQEWAQGAHDHRRSKYSDRGYTIESLPSDHPALDTHIRFFHDTRSLHITFGSPHNCYGEWCRVGFPTTITPGFRTQWMLGGHGVDHHRFRSINTWDFNANQAQDLYFFHRMPPGGFWIPAVGAPHDSDSDSDIDVESDTSEDTSSERSENTGSQLSEDEGGEGSTFADLDENAASQLETAQALGVEAEHDEDDEFLVYVYDDEH